MPEDPVDYHSEHAAEFAEDYPLEEKDEAFFELLETFMKLVGDGTVLDAGCGPGYETSFFADHGLEAIGVDAAEGMIKQARKQPHGRFEVMDLRDLAFEDGSFDGIWCNTTMQFFPPEEQATVLDEFARVLHPDGILYTTFKLGEGSVTTQDYGTEVKRYLVPEDEALEGLRDRGFEIIRTDTKELKWGLTVMNVFCLD